MGFTYGRSTLPWRDPSAVTRAPHRDGVDTRCDDAASTAAETKKAASPGQGQARSPAATRRATVAQVAAITCLVGHEHGLPGGPSS
jgi:hypothetical protein